MSVLTTKVTRADEFLGSISELNRYAKVPFNSAAWFNNWVDVYLTPDPSLDLFVLQVKDDQDGLIGVLPCFLSSAVVDGRTLKFLGDNEVCTEYQSIVCVPGRERDVCESLSRFLTKHHDEWEKISFDAVGEDDSTVALFCGLMSDSGNDVQKNSAMQCWRLELPSEWEEVLSLMSRAHRKQLKKVGKRLLSHPDFEVHIPEDETSLRKSIGILIDLHQKRWTSQGEPGCFASAEFTEFIQRATIDLLHEGRLFAPWISFEGEPIAADLNFASVDGLFGYQAGISPDHLDLQPGRAMNIVTIQSAIERGYKFVDFLRGDEEYKPKWRAIPRRMVSYQITPARMSAQVRKNVRAAGVAFKQACKQLLPGQPEPAFQCQPKN